MQEVNGKFEDNRLLITLSGRIDSNNSHQAEEEIKQLLQDKTAVPIVIDAENLEYILACVDVPGGTNEYENYFDEPWADDTPAGKKT